MPIRMVHLKHDLDSMVGSLIRSGQYANASEVIDSALRLLEREQLEYEDKLAALRSAVAEGLANGDAEDGVFDRISAYIDTIAAPDEGQKSLCEITA
jgi:antitoxin ParD1/3/4